MSRIGPVRRIARLLAGEGRLPPDFDGELGEDEHVLAVGHAPDGALVATTLGLWVPVDPAVQASSSHRRVSWHLVSHAAWNGSVLRVVEAEVLERLPTPGQGESSWTRSGGDQDAMVLRDLPEQRFALTGPSRLTDIVQRRVTASIRTSQRQQLDGGAVWVVQRIVPGRQRVTLQFRPGAGTDPERVRAFARRVVGKLGTPEDGVPPEAPER